MLRSDSTDGSDGGISPSKTKPRTRRTKPDKALVDGTINLKLMGEAFRAVKRNKGRAGVDRVSIEMFNRHLDQNLESLMRDLKRGTYRPRPVRRAYIDKGGGKLRPLGIPTVRTRCVRYADDFIVLCRTERQAKEARQAVELFLEQLGLSLSAEKTHVKTFRGGFTFLGFDVTSSSAKMRAKSVEKFKTRIRELTVRSHNLDAGTIGKLNAVFRGVARYFATWFATCVYQFRGLDGWLRMRLRCMQLKRKSRPAVAGVRKTPD